ncbi:MAG TPA: hypothetical protein VMV05_01660 [bacterium]|nr:hypothetical protein [bacterium]
MKKLLSGTLILAIALTGWAGLAAAATTDKPADKGNPPSGKPMARKAPPSLPAQLKAKLGLTDEQLSKINQILHKNGEDERLQMDQMKLDMDTLVQKLNDKASDSEIGKTLDAISADQKKMDDLREGKTDSLRSIMTPTQMAKFMLIRVRRPMPSKGGPSGSAKGKKNASTPSGGK